MQVIDRARVITALAVSAVLASTALMSYPIAAHSSSTAQAIRSKRQAGSGPLVITPALDTARAASAIITTDGGTVSATSANGTVFTLTIPPGALLDQENIMMTPIASIADLPFSGGIGDGGAVQLARTGTRH